MKKNKVQVDKDLGGKYKVVKITEDGFEYEDISTLEKTDTVFTDFVVVDEFGIEESRKFTDPEQVDSEEVPPQVVEQESTEEIPPIVNETEALIIEHNGEVIENEVPVKDLNLLESQGKEITPEQEEKRDNLREEIPKEEQDEDPKEDEKAEEAPKEKKKKTAKKKTTKKSK